jgi:8-hydroxy-5-deazaflavin:NADPH oxidoreductase
MNIAIIGTGNVGSALAKGWAKAGHEIYLGVRDMNNFKGKALLSYSSNIKASSIADAVRQSEVILIAATPQAVIEIAKSLGDVSNKTIIDAMNSVRMKPQGFNNTTEALTALTACPGIVKCFNTTGAENMLNPVYNNQGIDMFMSGDSIPAKEIAKQLAQDLGFENCYDFGGSDKFNLQEQLALSWINLAMMQGLGRDIAFKIVKR